MGRSKTMDTIAVLLEGTGRPGPSKGSTSHPPAEDDVVVAVEWSGISTGTERLLWSGRMPHFPGMGYPLVPGYELVGRVTRPGRCRAAGSASGSSSPARAASVRCAACSAVPPPGWSCPAPRWCRSATSLGESGVLLALAATAYHATARRRACSRSSSSAMACWAGCWRGWRSPPARRRPPSGKATPAAATAPRATGWWTPPSDDRRDYRAICDVSGDPELLDTLIARLAPGGEIVPGRLLRPSR